MTEIKGEIDNSTIIVGDFNAPLTLMDRTSRQKIKNRKHEQHYKTTKPNKHIRSTASNMRICILRKFTWNIL